MYTLYFYMDEDGNLPVPDFIAGLHHKLQAKVMFDLDRLREEGNTAREPLSKHLKDGIFEMRTIQGNDIVRLLYFYDKGQIIIATNAFIKKQQRTPRREMRLAMQRREEYWRTGRKG